MIGVIAGAADHDVVCEFFELFKTPWEFWRSDRRYDVVLSSGDECPKEPADLIIHYAGKRARFDDERRISVGSQRSHGFNLTYRGSRIPIYGQAVSFSGQVGTLLTIEGSRECVSFVQQGGGTALARVGYDLFNEVRALLTDGQPLAYAGIPTLEWHIEILRNIITACGIPLVEIPPVPHGYPFIACLTHDVDHPSIRQHKWDHTTVGFLARAIFGSVRRLVGRRMSVRDVFRNWASALKLPFIQLGLARDFWRQFDDRYLELENGLQSTFFMIPFDDYPGQGSHGSAPMFRAASYRAQDLADKIHKLVNEGNEVGLHGIDAWLDSASGRQELDEIRRLTGVRETGVRMHWLYYDHQSPVALEKAGAEYDSTIGYRETVGYRAGTFQAYKPLSVSRLLELPMHVMDMALLHPAHLGLSPQEASFVLGRMIDEAGQFGGCLTTNWHDRSIAPERLWDTTYRCLVQSLSRRGPWFATAAQAVSWFRKRRSVVFEPDFLVPQKVHARVVEKHRADLPKLRLRIHNAGGNCSERVPQLCDYTDKPIVEDIDNAAFTMQGAERTRN